MSFIGQDRIKEEMLGFVEQIKKGKNFSFLITAPSGCGKNDFTFRITYMITGDNRKVSYYNIKGEFEFNYNNRIHVFDEIHNLTTPEVLYPIMDSKKYTIFLLTNEKGELKEPLRNRCITFAFVDYTEGEVTQIVKEKLEQDGFYLPDNLCSFIARESNLNPRVAKEDISVRLVNLFRMKGTAYTEQDLKYYLETYLGIVNGLNQDCRKYLEFLRKRNNCSLDLISNAIQLEKEYIKRQIEPLLVKRGLIDITSRGRSISKQYFEL
jgi:Holliday junction resolvasome RuvABC ATP-dependent DNA helicase subunit